jgi:hypothetical protein
MKLLCLRAPPDDLHLLLVPSDIKHILVFVWLWFVASRTTEPTSIQDIQH